MAESHPELESLRGLADLNDWRNLDLLAGEPPFVAISPQVTNLLAEIGAAREAAGDAVAASHCYRLALWNNAVYCQRAENSEEWQRRYWIAADVRWKGTRASRTAPLADECWAEYMPRVEQLLEAGDFERAETLLVMLEATPDESGAGSIAVADRLEKMGDALVRDHREAARWCYRVASDRFHWWVASSSSGGEGLARSEEPDTAAVKLARLDRS